MSIISSVKISISKQKESHLLKPTPLLRVHPFREMLLLPGKIQSHDECFFDEELGLKISVFESETDLFFIFGDADSAATELPMDRVPHFARQQRKWSKANLRGENPYPYTEAERVVRALVQRSRFCEKKVIVCGEGFGGSIAEYVGLV